MTAPDLPAHLRRTMLTAEGAAQVIWHNAELLPDPAPEFFEPDWHRANGSWRGSAQGRGQTHFLKFGGGELVLRRYARGGLIGRLVAGSYLRLGAPASRSFREFRLLDWLHRQGLAVPRPAAARYAPSGLAYRADLVTERIPDAVPLAEVLTAAPLPEDVWAGVGAAVRRMHALGVDHVDLNCRNILLDRGSRVWLIDFDKCRRRRPGGWSKGNLARLQRSLASEAARVSRLFWTDADWSALLDGYRRAGLSDAA
jgi:tRNA A-37 threonylcarbamoyl transferase component Bud32